jgi:hypothetical protein
MSTPTLLIASMIAAFLLQQAADHAPARLDTLQSQRFGARSPLDSSSSG